MNETLRIVHCFRSPVGGIFRHVRDLCEAQAAAGHQVGIVCDSTTGGAFEARLFETMTDKLQLGVVRTPMQRNIGMGDAAASRRVFRILREMRPDVLHGHGAKGGAYARLLGTLMRISGRHVARIYSPHGGSLHYDAGSLVGRLFFGLEKTMDRFRDHLVFVSDYERRTFAAKIGAPRKPWSLIYNGLRNTEFEPVATSPDAADFLYVGMMRDLKGPDLFLDALAEAERRSGRALSAFMVGDGDDLPRYVEQARTLGFGDRVMFRPAMPARQAFALARTVIVPSRAEAMPYIVLEALAAGKPMVATTVGGIPEIFARHPAALVAPDATDLAERMSTVLADEDAFMREMPPPEELKARFGVDVMTAATEHIYLTALGHRSS